MTSTPRLHAVLALVLGIGLTVAACSGGEPSSSSSSDAERPPSSATETTLTVDEATQQAWETIDDGLAELGPEVSLLVARVALDGTCEPVHEVEPATARPTASQFKLFVLGALAHQIAAGQVSWDQTVTVREEDRSFGNGEGSLEKVAPGTAVTVEEAATKMISISDNTATDILIGLVGRDAVEAQAREWMADASANDPFLTTREMFLLHYVDGLADQYLATPQDQRDAFLASSVDPRPLSDIYPGLDLEPHYVDTIEWFASPDDVCRAFAGLQELSTGPSLAPLSTILSQRAAIELARSDWPTVWYKGGSEPGVLTLGWLATTSDGETYVVEAMVTNPDAALDEDSITDLVALAKDAFALLGSR
jgi:beta-lactamase class A